MRTETTRRVASTGLHPNPGSYFYSPSCPCQEESFILYYEFTPKCTVNSQQNEPGGLFPPSLQEFSSLAGQKCHSAGSGQKGRKHPPIRSGASLTPGSGRLGVHKELGSCSSCHLRLVRESGSRATLPTAVLSSHDLLPNMCVPWTKRLSVRHCVQGMALA